VDRLFSDVLSGDAVVARQKPAHDPTELFSSTFCRAIKALSGVA
jgi:hypothetical protein